MILPLLLIGLTSCGISLATTPILRYYSIRLGLIDQPDGQRKVHGAQIPRIGGVAIAAAYLLSFLAVSTFMELPSTALTLLWRFLPGTGIVFALGLYDDIRGMKARHKLLGQFIAALTAVFLGIRIDGPPGHSQSAWWTLPVTILWLIICTNAINLIDGLDGLATGIGICAAATIICAAVMQGDLAFAAIGIPLVGALLGFLRFNANPATIFLGDGGSLPIGFFLGCYAVTWSQQAASLFSLGMPLVALAVPLTDVALTIGRRFLRGQPIFRPDRGHIHHRLLARGHTARSAAVLLYGAAVFFSVAALCIHASSLQAPCLVVTALAAGYMIRYLNYAEFSIARRALTVGSFRRLISDRLLLHTLEKQLRLAGTPDACWGVLRTVYRDFGFHEIAFQFNGELHVDRFETEQSSWGVDIPLAAGNFVSFRYGSSLRLHDEVIGGLIFIVRDTLIRSIRVRSQSASAPQILAPVISRSAAGGI